MKGTLITVRSQLPLIKQKWYEDASESEKRTFEKKNPSKTDEHDTNPRAGKLLDSDVIVEYEEEQWIVKSKGAKGKQPF